MKVYRNVGEVSTLLKISKNYIYQAAARKMQIRNYYYLSYDRNFKMPMFIKRGFKSIFFESEIFGKRTDEEKKYLPIRHYTAHKMYGY